MTQLCRELTEGSVRTILALRRGYRGGGGVEVWRLLLAEVRRVTAKALLRCRRGMRRLHCGLALVEVCGQTVLRVLLLVLLRKQSLSLVALRVLVRGEGWGSGGNIV